MPKSATRGRVAGEQHVVGLDVAVDDAELVGVGERAGHVAQDAHDLARRAVGPGREPGAEGLALHERHRVVEQPVGVAGAQHGHDVRMLELGGDLDLAAEPVDVDAVGQLRREHLDDHPALERCLRRHEHARHSTRELALEGVARCEGGLKTLAERVRDALSYGRGCHECT